MNYLLIPGWSTGPVSWQRIAERLQGCEVVDISQCVSVDEFSRCVIDRVEHRYEKYGAVDLVGWSMGTAIAIDAARNVSSKISSLSLISAIHEPWHELMIARMRRKLRVDLADVIASFDRRMFTNCQHIDADVHLETWCHERTNYQWSNLALDVGLQYLANQQSVCKLQLNLPVRFLHGDKDAVCLRPDACNCDVSTVSDGSHALIWTHADVVTDWLLSLDA